MVVVGVVVVGFAFVVAVVVAAKGVGSLQCHLVCTIFVPVGEWSSFHHYRFFLLLLLLAAATSPATATVAPATSTAAAATAISTTTLPLPMLPLLLVPWL